MNTNLFFIPEVVVSDKELSPKAKILYCYIYSLNKQNKKLIIHNKDIADYLECHIRTVQRLLLELKNLDYITIQTIQNKEDFDFPVRDISVTSKPFQ